MTTTAPVALYRDADVYERERQSIFARTWQFFGLEADVARAGDYLAESIAGYPLVVVRDEGGVLRSYHNLCRHRAGPLAGEARGRCEGALVCRFHGWRYAYDGRLVDLAGFKPPEDFDAAAFALYPIRVESWRGLVFVNLDPDAAPLAEALAPLDGRLGAQPRRPARLRDRHPVHCNWKVYVENYLDGHWRHDHSHEVGFHRGGPDETVLSGDTALYTSGHDQEAALWSWTWPNLGLSVRRGILMIEHVRPDGPDHTLIEHLFLHESEDPRVEVAIHHSERVSEEDAWISSRVQQNIDAGVYETGVLSPQSDAFVAWFQARIVQATGQGHDPPGSAGTG